MQVSTFKLRIISAYALQRVTNRRSYIDGKYTEKNIKLQNIIATEEIIWHQYMLVIDGPIYTICLTLPYRAAIDELQAKTSKVRNGIGKLTSVRLKDACSLLEQWYCMSEYEQKYSYQLLVSFVVSMKSEISTFYEVHSFFQDMKDAKEGPMSKYQVKVN
ncbi:hypothetical protein Tco_1123407 [Tanacetum coccineum]|uniref:Uncharacterized protein n=1 Tax=Tanacetum coccineum TaxID=301880 RepID=A0ABQ5J632_9ASTR